MYYFLETGQNNPAKYQIGSRSDL